MKPRQHLGAAFDPADTATWGGRTYVDLTEAEQRQVVAYQAQQDPESVVKSLGLPVAPSLNLPLVVGGVGLAAVVGAVLAGGR